MSSFIPGKKKKSGDSIMVRGFWGDIINSPFATFGFEVRDEVDREKFFRKLNFQRIYVIINSLIFLYSLDCLRYLCLQCSRLYS